MLQPWERSPVAPQAFFVCMVGCSPAIVRSCPPSLAAAAACGPSAPPGAYAACRLVGRSARPRSWAAGTRRRCSPSTPPRASLSSRCTCLPTFPRRRRTARQHGGSDPPWQCPNLARAPPRAPGCSGVLGAPGREPTGPLPRAKLTSRLRAACLHWTGAGFDPLHGVSRLQPYRRAGPNQLRPALGGNQLKNPGSA